MRPFGGLTSVDLLQYWIRHLAGSAALSPRITQTTIQHLPLERFVEVEIPLPPGHEQAAIVEAIETQLTRLDAAVAALAASAGEPEALPRFRSQGRRRGTARADGG